MLSNKRILFISPCFFNYEKEIKAKLERMGATVDFYDERPSNNSVAKALIRIDKRLISFFIKQHYSRILEKIGGLQYDYFFLIKGEATPPFFLAKLREKLPDAKFVYYTYDSIINNRNALNNIRHFDRKFTFDDKDISEVKDLQFRPLFYLDEYSSVSHSDIRYDLSFIGTVHSDRYQFIMRLQQNIREKSTKPLKVFLFLYCQSKWYYYFRKLTDSTFRSARRDEISFAALSKESIFSIFSESNCIIDIQHPNQSGLTMRTLEAVGARKKIITTNPNVMRYDIYDPANIQVVDRLNPEVDAQFFDTAYVKLPDEVYQKYAIENFLLDLLIR
jgi:hypothetical protein